MIERSSNEIFADIRKMSETADLVMLGMRPPLEDESDADYRDYYQKLLEDTKDMPPTVMVLAAEEMDHYAIFEAE